MSVESAAAAPDDRAVHIVAPTTRENIHVRAMRTLVEGRVGIEEVRPGLVRAWVRCLNGHIHHVAWESSRGWTCNCEAAPSARCYHAEAVVRVVVLPDDGDAPPSWGERIARP